MLLYTFDTFPKYNTDANQQRSILKCSIYHSMLANNIFLLTY